MLSFSPTKKECRNGDRDLGGPLGNDRHYPYRSGGGHGSPHSTQGGGHGGPPDYPY